MRPALLALYLSTLPAIASADAMPACPPGTELRTHPVAPGAMHHSGGECVEPPGAGGCASCAIAPRPPRATIVLAALLVGLRARRTRTVRRSR